MLCDFILSCCLASAVQLYCSCDNLQSVISVALSGDKTVIWPEVGKAIGGFQ
jgi:hypothetical protein